MDGWDGMGMDGWDGDGWRDGWTDCYRMIGWDGRVRAHKPARPACECTRERSHACASGMAPNAGDARDAGDAPSTASSESVGDAGNAVGLLHICSILSLFPSRAPMADPAVMMHQSRWACRRCGGSAAATVSRKAKPRHAPFGQHSTARPDFHATRCSWPLRAQPIRPVPAPTHPPTASP